ncbi:HNH endonuclease signature motif containing protein [Tessaracoccus terricola]
MDTTAQLLAEELVATDHLSQQAAARRVMLVAELATNYDVVPDDVMPVLADRGMRLGAGTPEVSEYVCLEVAGLLRLTPSAAASLVSDAVNLKYRHPGLYRWLVDLAVDPDRALAAARRCAELPAAVADEVTSKWLKVQHRYAWTGAMTQLAKIIINLDPEAAAKREQEQRKQLGVHVWGLYEGTMNLTGRLEALDARYLDAAVAQLADIIRPQYPDATTEVLRARALGVLAHPAYTLALLQQAAQPAPAALPEQPSPADHPDGPQRHDPHGCPGHLCGTITTPVHKLRPRVGVVIHLHVDAVSGLEGAARLEKAGHITVESLREALAGADLTVQPVIDLNDLPAEDQYVPSAGLRRSVGLAAPNELFPFSDRASPGLDLDHTVPYTRGATGQTRMGNLAPLSRRVHRAKTAEVWKVEQPSSMLLRWRSPLGYRYEVHPAKGTRRLVPETSSAAVVRERVRWFTYDGIRGLGPRVRMLDRRGAAAQRERDTPEA